jgi:hypothetical protein
MARDVEQGVEDLYGKIQLPDEWVEGLTRELEEEIVERQATAGELRVALTKRLAGLADERQKLLRAYYANAIPLELLGVTRIESPNRRKRPTPSWPRPRPISTSGRKFSRSRSVSTEAATTPQGEPEGASSVQRRRVESRLPRGRQGQARRVHGLVRDSFLTPEFE